jgi:acyl-CoA reductase-like NAD-dependent aldehyde dehydrogenase
MSADKLMHINGEGVESSPGQRFDSENPANGEILDTVPRGNAADIATALECAKLGGRRGIPCFDETAEFLSRRGIALPQ